MNRCQKVERKSRLMPENVCGSSDSRSDIANSKGPPSCEGLRGRSIIGLFEMWRDMKVIAVIEDSGEIKRILRHLVRTDVRPLLSVSYPKTASPSPIDARAPSDSQRPARY